MTSKEELVERFPSSFAKYEASFVASTIEGDAVDPVELLYEKTDLHPDEGMDDMAERLAFEHTKALQLFLDARDHLFSSRKLDRERLAKWLTDKYGYDIVRTKELADSTNPMFLILFYKAFSPNKVELSELFEKGRAVAYDIGDKRDRMTTLGHEVEIDTIVDGISEFQENAQLSNAPAVLCTTYNSDRKDEVTVMLQEEKGRYLRRQFEFRTKNESQDGVPELDYVERYPIHENAVRFTVSDGRTTVKSRRAVSTWEVSLTRLFSKIFERNIVEDLQETESETTKEIVENVKENSAEESNDEEQDENPPSLPETVTEGVTEAAAATAIDSEDTDLDEDFINRRIGELTVTGVEIDGEDTTFEIHNTDGIQKLLMDFEGLSNSLSQAIASASHEDITVYATLPGGEDMDEFVIENDEWYMNGDAAKSNIELLEEVL